MVVVGTPEVEPSLAAVIAESLARVGPEPVVVLNRRAPGGDAWGEVAFELPEARMAAHLALAGREPRGDLGRVVAGLADRCGRCP